MQFHIKSWQSEWPVEFMKYLYLKNAPCGNNIPALSDMQQNPENVLSLLSSSLWLLSLLKTCCGFPWTTVTGYGGKVLHSSLVSQSSTFVFSSHYRPSEISWRRDENLILSGFWSSWAVLVYSCTVLFLSVFDLWKMTSGCLFLSLSAEASFMKLWFWNSVPTVVFIWLPSSRAVNGCHWLVFKVRFKS